MLNLADTKLCIYICTMYKYMYNIYVHVFTFIIFVHVIIIKH